MWACTGADRGQQWLSDRGPKQLGKLVWGEGTVRRNLHLKSPAQRQMMKTNRQCRLWSLCKRTGDELWDKLHFWVSIVKSLIKPIMEEILRTFSEKCQDQYVRSEVPLNYARLSTVSQSLMVFDPGNVDSVLSTVLLINMAKWKVSTVEIHPQHVNVNLLFSMCYWN